MTAELYGQLSEQYAALLQLREISKDGLEQYERLLERPINQTCKK